MNEVGVMWKGKQWVTSMALAILGGCATVPQEAVVLPVGTPFDADPFARQAYIDAYQAGYRAVKHNGPLTPSFYRGPYPMARQIGWRAGAAAAYDRESGSSNRRE